ncbi:Nif11-like leader peptide family natural product precursor [Actinoallomurus sp. CA-142502]|uniref:Nif11-like leader peptide family natural product precursor n=1 Tax=Actinoallomurus sp. CA-142502 TaxID=3239885 RepID=UPI003D8E94A3
MSVESSRAFLQIAYDSPELKQQLKAVTGTREIVRLGSRYGYSFDVPELMEASSAFTPGETPEPVRRPTEAERDAGPLHHEYLLEDLPGLKGVIDQLPHLKIKPPSFDLDRFARTFREEDLRSTGLSPADPAFQAWHESMMKAHWRDPALGTGAPRRDFHLVNLDEHVDHPGYDRYLEAKHRMVRTLEEFFSAEIRFSGSLWYPPSGYRLWHTNETQPGWRMYVVDFDEPFADPADTSFFRYMNPRTEEIVTLRETPRMVRFFKAEQDPRRLFWHCIVNPTPRHRWSFGFVVPDHWMTAVARQV